jgi:calcium uniporter protein, mitochondrial
VGFYCILIPYSFTGKLSPTSSHLLKLILPIDLLRLKDPVRAKANPPTVFLLHPSQPLSHIGRLVGASLRPRSVNVTFQSVSPKGKAFEWSDSTDLGDFIRDAARAREFSIHVREDEGKDLTLQVDVPTFADRTRFLRRKLDLIQDELRTMETLKKRCDQEAHRGARKMALGGLGMLIVYWGTVARLTFWDLGWYVNCRHTRCYC